MTTLEHGRRPYALVQLRQDDKQASLYNMVGFQTNLKYGEQKRIFSKIPGLEQAEFVKYGVMHRNTYINSSQLLDETYQLKAIPNLYFAGQITGVEGYVESISSGLVAGLNASYDFLDALKTRKKDELQIAYAEERKKKTSFLRVYDYWGFSQVCFNT